MGCVVFPACITGHMIRGSASRGWADSPLELGKARGTHPTGMLSCFRFTDVCNGNVSVP